MFTSMSIAAIGSGLKVASGLLGAFGVGRKKKSALQQASEKFSLAQLKQQQALLPGQTSLMKKVQADALAYDPEHESKAMREQLEASAARTADIGQRSIMGAVARGGGVMGGDTNILRLRQRSLDQAGSPVLMELARIRAGQSATKQAMLMNAARMGEAGGFANSVTMAGLNQPQDDRTGSLMGLASGVDEFVTAQNNAQRKKRSVNRAKVAGSLGTQLGRWM